MQRERSPKRPSMLALCLALALGAALATGALVSRFTGGNPEQRYIQTYSEKFAAIARAPSQVDVLFVGTSQLLNDVAPAAFDPAATGDGPPVRSYNMSLVNLSYAEQERILRDLYALPGFAPEWVVLEPTFRLGRAWANLTSARNVYFTDTAGLTNSAGLITSTRRSAPAKAYNLFMAGIAWVIHTLDYGGLSDALFPGRRRHQRAPDIETTLARRGHSRAESAPGEASAVPGFPERAHEARETNLRDRRNAQDDDTLLPASESDRYADLVASVRARGARAVFVLPPLFRSSDPFYRERTYQFVRSAGAQPARLPLISYLDPQRTPALYETRYWRDEKHLNGPGADLFSARLARDLRQFAGSAGGLRSPSEPTGPR